MNQHATSPADGLVTRWQLGAPFTIGEASRVLGIPESTLRDRLRGAPVSSTRGRVRYYAPSTIEARAFGGEP